MSIERPRRKYELDLRIHGDTWEDIVRELQDLAQHAKSRGPECSSVSIGSSSGYIITVRHDPNMTGDLYQQQLEEYLKSEEAEDG